MIKFYSPASIGNIGVGFDILGIAIKPIDGTLLGDQIHIKNSNTFHFKKIGKFSKELPKKINENIVWKVWEEFKKKKNIKQEISITLEKNMPIGSGLGSSASSIVASMLAFNEIYNFPFTRQEMLLLMGKMEKKISGSIHYDNVAPCYLGGLQLIINENKIICQKLPIFKNWYWIISWPGTNFSTSQARQILPKKYKKNICIKNSKNIATFIHALYTNQENLALQSMQDSIAEPYRIPLLPGFSDAKSSILKLGALQCGISGSGPTLFSICNSLKNSKKIKKWLDENYIKNEKGFTHICIIDEKGSRKIR